MSVSNINTNLRSFGKVPHPHYRALLFFLTQDHFMLALPPEVFVIRPSANIISFLGQKSSQPALLGCKCWIFLLIAELFLERPCQLQKPCIIFFICKCFRNPHITMGADPCLSTVILFFKIFYRSS